MTITYSWNVKYLKEDERGYASTLYCELQGVDGDKKATSSCSISFGGDDYKPKSQWTQEQIDVFADTMKSSLEAEIQYQFDNPIQEQLSDNNLKAPFETLEA